MRGAFDARPAALLRPYRAKVLRSCVQTTEPQAAHN